MFGKYVLPNQLAIDTFKHRACDTFSKIFVNCSLVEMNDVQIC